MKLTKAEKQLIRDLLAGCWLSRATLRTYHLLRSKTGRKWGYDILRTVSNSFIDQCKERGVLSVQFRDRGTGVSEWYPTEAAIEAFKQLAKGSCVPVTLKVEE